MPAAIDGGNYEVICKDSAVPFSFPHPLSNAIATSYSKRSPRIALATGQSNFFNERSLLPTRCPPWVKIMRSGKPRVRVFSTEIRRFLPLCFPCHKAALFGFPIADGSDRLDWLRVVRHLPVCAELSKPGEAWGQVLDKPPGRKPRGRADTDQQSRGSMGN